MKKRRTLREFIRSKPTHLRRRYEDMKPERVPRLLEVSIARAAPRDGAGEGEK